MRIQTGLQPASVLPIPQADQSSPMAHHYRPVATDWCAVLTMAIFYRSVVFVGRRSGR